MFQDGYGYIPGPKRWRLIHFNRKRSPKQNLISMLLRGTDYAQWGQPKAFFFTTNQFVGLLEKFYVYALKIWNTKSRY